MTIHPNDRSTSGRDVIVVGASAGGVEALVRLVRQLPKDLPAAVLIVLHVSPNSPGALPRILQRHSPLPAALAVDGEPVERGRLYVAPPDYHMLVDSGHVMLNRGPKAHRVRPAIDPLFSAAARTYGARAVGVILSGTRGDGAAGLAEIRQCGGVAIVQDPTDAMYPEMPHHAIHQVGYDYLVPVVEMGQLLGSLAGTPLPKEDGVAMQALTDELNQRMREDTVEQIEGRRAGEPALYTCPECGGTLWQVPHGELLQFKCHISHVYSAEELVAGQATQAENAIWTAVRTMIDNAKLARQIAVKLRADGDERGARRLEEKATTVDQHWGELRRLFESGELAIQLPLASQDEPEG